MSTTASAITRSGRPETWLAFRNRAKASCSDRPSFAISKPFARSIAFRAASASASDSASVAQRRELLVPGPRRLDRGQQIRLAKRLHEIPEDADLDRARDELLLPVRRQHHHRDRPLVEDAARRLDPVEPRHLHVEDGQVRQLGAGERDRLLAVARLGADLEAGALEQRAEVEPDDRLVLGDQDAQRSGHAASLRTFPSYAASETARFCASMKALPSGS